MDEAKLEEYLRMVGKANFVKYFEQLNDPTLTNQAVAEYIVDDSGCSSKSALGRRVGPARSIIRAGQSRAAMLLISDSNRLPRHIVESAARIAKWLEVTGNP